MIKIKIKEANHNQKLLDVKVAIFNIIAAPASIVKDKTSVVTTIIQKPKIMKNIPGFSTIYSTVLIS
jgi:hypothetical protein